MHVTTLCLGVLLLVARPTLAVGGDRITGRAIATRSEARHGCYQAILYDAARDIYV